MIDLAYPLAAVVITAITAYCFLEWLKAFKRRNDLIDRFQGFERANDARLTYIETKIEELDGVRQRFDNLVPNHEKLVARVTALDEYTKAEISKLGHNVLDQVAEMKTQQAASFQQAQIASRISPRVFKP